MGVPPVGVAFALPFAAKQDAVLVVTDTVNEDDDVIVIVAVPTLGMQELSVTVTVYVTPEDSPVAV